MFDTSRRPATVKGRTAPARSAPVPGQRPPHDLGMEPAVFASRSIAPPKRRDAAPRTRRLRALPRLEAGDLSSAGESLATVNEALPNIVQELGDRVGEDLREQVDAAVELQTEAVDVVEETAGNADQAETGDDDIFDDGIVPDL